MFISVLQAVLDINLFWDLSCRTSEGNFHLSEMKIHLPTFFVWYSLTGFSAPITAFSIKEGWNFTCPVGQAGWEVQLSRTVRQSLMSSLTGTTGSMFLPLLVRHYWYLWYLYIHVSDVVHLGSSPLWLSPWDKLIYVGGTGFSKIWWPLFGGNSEPE